MGAGTKILAGCGCVAIVAVVAVVASVGLGAFWLKGKTTDLAGSLEGLTSTSNEIDEWEREANANPYDRPVDGVIEERRLEAFLDVRRQVHDVYLTCKVDLEALQARVQDSGEAPSPTELFSAASRAARMFSDLRLAQVKGLAGAGMSEEEYYAIQTAVYMAAGAWKTSEATGSLPAEAMAEATRQVREAMKAGIEKAREEGVPGTAGLSDAELQRLEEALSQAGASGAEALAVPPANVELFRRHQADIEKYAMHGLAFLGL